MSSELAQLGKVELRPLSQHETEKPRARNLRFKVEAHANASSPMPPPTEEANEMIFYFKIPIPDVRNAISDAEAASSSQEAEAHRISRVEHSKSLNPTVKSNMKKWHCVKQMTIRFGLLDLKYAGKVQQQAKSIIQRLLLYPGSFEMSVSFQFIGFLPTSMYRTDVKESRIRSDMKSASDTFYLDLCELVKDQADKNVKLLDQNGNVAVDDIAYRA